jgi:hypothetical protein
MKRPSIIVVVVLFAAFASGNAFAANGLEQGSTAVSVGMGDSIFAHTLAPQTTGYMNNVVDISGRYFVGKDMAIYGGVGLQLNSGDFDGAYLSFTAGLRKYLSTNDFAPFVGGQLAYATVDGKLRGVTFVDEDVVDLAALFGAEYFFSKNFSLEGAIGVAMGRIDDSHNHADSTYLGTRTIGVHANFYF